MKKLGKAVCLAVVLCMLVTVFAGCERKPGLYAWYGGRIDVDNVLKITVDAGDGAKSYDVPFETYRAVFIYLKGIVSDTIVDEDGNAKIATKKEKRRRSKKSPRTLLSNITVLWHSVKDMGLPSRRRTSRRITTII